MGYLTVSRAHHAGGPLHWVLSVVLCCTAERCSSLLTVRVVAQGRKGTERKVRQPEKMSVTVSVLKRHQGSDNLLTSTSQGSDSIFKFTLVIHYSK